MPSFDTVSEVDLHEVTNAVDMAKRELATRWDFKNVQADVEFDKKKSYSVKQGLDQDVAKKIVKLIKESSIKVQVSIQGDKVRVTGKKRDELQDVIRLLRDAELEAPLQFNNFRD
jgi:cyclic-di-GMP-binding protein